MRLDRLELRAFGPFTKQVLDFEDRQPDFHIVLGSNEAGKSSALDAITCALYGFPHTKTYDFVHDGRTLRVGMVLRDAGQPLAFVRRRGNKKTVRDAADQDALPEGHLETCLGGVSRERFLSYYGLSHGRLRAGGREILESGGDLGEALFAAASSVTGLHEQYERLCALTDAFFRPQARKLRFNELKGAYEERRKRVEEAALGVRKWEEVTGRLKELRERRERFRQRVASLQSEAERLKRIQGALQHLGPRKERLEELAKLRDAPLLPEDFGERRARAERELRAAREEAERARGSMERLAREIEALPMDDKLRARATEVQELADLASQQRKACADAEKLQRELAGHEAQAARLSEDIRPGSEAAALAETSFTAMDRARVRELGDEKRELDQERRRLEADIAARERERASAVIDLDQLKTLGDPAPLRAALEQARRQGDLESLAAEARRAAGAKRADMNAAASALPLWEGAAEDLTALPVPSVEVVRQRAEQWRRLAEEMERAEARLEENAGRIGALRAELADLEADGAAPSEDELSERRRRRERGWALVLEAWTAGRPPHGAPSADEEAYRAEADEAPDLARAYETAVRAADDAADRLRKNSERAAAVADRRKQLEKLDPERDCLSADRDALRNRREEEEAAWKALWEPAGVYPGPPAEALPWLERQQELVQDAEELRAAEAKARDAESRLSLHRKRLAVCLEALGEAAPAGEGAWHALVERAAAALERLKDALKRRENLREDLAALEDDTLPAARDELERVAKLESAWREAWDGICERVGAPADNGPRVLEELLDRLDDLRQVQEKAAGLRRRLRDIAADAEEFETRAADLSAEAAPELSGLQALDAADELRRRLQEAVEANAHRTELDRQRETAVESLGAAEARAAGEEAELERLCKEAGCASPDDLPEAQAGSNARRDLERELRELDDRILEWSAGAPLDSFIEEARREDPDALAARMENLRHESREASDEAEALSEEIGGMEREQESMDGGSQAAAAAQEAEQVLSALTEEAGDYLRRRIAAHALREAMERYRRERQGPVLAQASEYFRTLTLGSFTGLEADLDPDGAPTLYALRTGATEQQLGVEALSDGTLDQLYLALRLAVHVQEDRPALPFILDDILVNFDDERSSAALRVLAELAGRTQVIFFTHHQHLVDLALDALADAPPAVHALPGPRDRAG